MSRLYCCILRRIFCFAPHWPTHFAYVIARIGPKHASLISNFLYVPALLLLIMLHGMAYGRWLAVEYFRSVGHTVRDGLPGRFFQSPS